MTFIEAYNKFREIEDEFNLFDQRIQGFPFWDYLRFSVFQQVLCTLENRTHHHPRRQTLKNDKLARIKNWFYYLNISALRNPFLARECDYLFIGHPRRKLRSDNTYWDIYCDPVINYLGKNNCLLLEAPFMSSHMRPAHTKRIVYTDIFNLYHKLHSTSFNKLELTSKENQLLIETQSLVCQKTGLKIDLSKLVQNYFRTKNQITSVFEKLLKKASPKIVFIVCSYGKEHYIQACRNLGIPVIELQHGTVVPMHVGYSFPHIGAKSTFPDYVFGFGNYWKETVNYPIDKKNVFTIGYPYMDSQLKNLENISKKEQAIFISQPPIGKPLSRFAVKMAGHLPSGWEIIYKLHPGEVPGWQEEYPELAESGIKVITGESPGLYELLAESKMQIGVYSTAVFEGLALGCKTYLVNLPGVEYVQPLIDQKICTLIHSPEEIDFDAPESDNKFNKDYFFADNWQKNLDDAIVTLGLEQR